MATIWRLFILACPKCGSEDLRVRCDYVGCAFCGAWVYRKKDETLVELDWRSPR